MSRFDFEELDKLSPLEKLCRLWYQSAVRAAAGRDEKADMLGDSMKRSRILEAMKACNPCMLDKAALNSAAAGAESGLAGALENAWKQLMGQKAYCGWGELYADNIETYVRYHDRYYPVTFHNHGFIEIVFLVKGRCWHHVGDDILEMRQGDVVIIPTGTVHSVFSFSDENIIFNMHISFRNFERNFLTLLISQNILGEFFRRAFYSKEERKSYFIIHTGDYFLGENILADIWREINSELPYKQDVLNAQVKLLFLHLLRFYPDSMFTAVIDSDDPAAIVEMMKYIQNNFRDVTVDKLCTRFGYSDRQIFRLVRRYTGSTLGELQKKLRMKHAEMLLTVSALTVDEIAADCGYRSVNNFYATFRQEYGMTPRAYRETHRR